MDEEFMRKAVASADLNALRIALYQASGDESLADITLEFVSQRGGATVQAVVAQGDAEMIMGKALGYLTGGQADPEVESVPDDWTLRRLMEMFRGVKLSDPAFAYLKDAIAFDALARTARWTTGTKPVGRDLQVVILGAGLSGLAMAVQLEHLGVSYSIFERRGEPGGTWSINTYPGCRVDTSNFVYQYTYIKRYPWSEYYATQPEVLNYIKFVADEYNITSKINFGHEVTEAQFDETSSSWQLDVRTPEGRGVRVRADVVVAACGLFATPRGLDVPGIAKFQGEIVHTARWTEEHCINSKRVAIVGNGSTGVQLLKSVAEAAEKVFVFQRTPQWISPRENYGEPISAELRWLIDTMPYYWNWHMFSLLSMALTMQDNQERDSDYESRSPGHVNARNEAFRQSLTRYIRTQIGERDDLFSVLVPDYPPLARRLVVDNNWYRCLLRDNVELVTAGIERVTESGLVATDGIERKVDTVIAATGFSTSKYLYPIEFRGRGGIPLAEVWRGETGGPRAYLGLAMPGFPNLFVMYGPNSQIRAGSLISWFEIWARYVGQAIVLMTEKNLQSVEVKQDVFDAYQAELDRRAQGLVWSDPGSRARNYYVNEQGRVQVGSPWRVEEWYAYFEQWNDDDYVLTPAEDHETVVGSV